jgi:hypothetical protein
MLHRGHRNDLRGPQIARANSELAGKWGQEDGSPILGKGMYIPIHSPLIQHVELIPSRNFPAPIFLPTFPCDYR